MATKSTEETNWLQNAVGRLAKLHFVFVAMLAAQIILYDASKLITPEIVLKRWLYTTGLLIVTIAVWYLARSKFTNSTTAYKLLAFALIIADIVIAAFNVYTQRGMASRAVLLFAIPIIVSAVLMSRAALFATAALCIAVYTATAQAYFVLNFNEGYKVELYGEVGFYSASFLLLAGLLSTVTRAKPKN